MKLDVITLRRISPLLDEALDLGGTEREAWLASLSGEAAELAPILRELLAKQASVETNDLLERGPQFTAPGLDAGASEFKEGDSVGPYRLIRELGHGGMGEVWLAERSDGVLKRSVALKLPTLGLRRNVLVQRFERERDILGALAHPNIARLYDAGLAADGQPFLALEYVEGLPITAYCEQQKLDSRARIRLLLQVMDAVQYAHANLVIHRDLKPSNVLVTGEAKAMLLDFGIAKLLQDETGEAQETELTQLGGRALTLDYAAPEQVTGAPISTATDVYALGVLLYELLTGERPFSGTRREIEQAILTQEPARPKALPTDLGVIVLKALKKAPAERYGTVEAFAQDLGRWQRGEVVLAQPDSLGYRTRKFVVRHWLPVSAAVGVVIALAVGIGAALWQAARARTEAQTAEAVQKFLEQIFKANASNQSDPQKARNTTARELLDVGAKKIDAALSDSPKAKIGVYATLGEMYSDLGIDKEAAALHGKRAELARNTYGKNSEELVEALLAEAGALSSKLDDPQWEKALTEAKAILDRRGDFDSPLRAKLLGQYAGFYQERDLTRAIQSAEDAVKILRRYPSGREFVIALQIAAVGYSLKGEWAKCRPLLEEALAVAQGRGGEVMPDLLPELYNSLGDTDERLNDMKAAGENLLKAWEQGRARNGEYHVGTILFLVDYANHLFLVGHSAEGIAKLEQALDAFKQTKGADAAENESYVLGTYGNDLAYYGRFEEALSALNLARESLAKAGDTPRLGHVLEEIASLNIELGRYDEANKLLDQAISMRAKAKMTEGSWQEANDKIRVRLLLARGRVAEANEIAHRFLKHDSEIRKMALRPRLSQSYYRERLALATKDWQTALLLSREALDLIAREPETSRIQFLVWEQREGLTAGKALIGMGRTNEAEPLLRRSLELCGQIYDPVRSPELADVQITLANCLLDQGRRTEARALAEKARKIHSMHSELGEHHRILLKQIEARMANG